MIKINNAEKIVLAFMLFIAAMLVMRIAYANNVRYLFLLWNLFLAWIPFQLSIRLSHHKTGRRWYQYMLLFTWLLFFPNALYIITDLIHLENLRDVVPVWFDAILLFTCSVAGLFMAFVSLYEVEVFLAANMQRKHINKLVVAILFAGSFGVYVGRFLRWNSWDMITNPMELTAQLAMHIAMPTQHVRTWVVTILLTGSFSILYFGLKQLPAIAEEGTWTQQDR